MTGLGTEIGYGGQGGMEYPLTPDPVPDLDPGGKTMVLTPRLDSVGVAIGTMPPPDGTTGRVTVPMNTAVRTKSTGSLALVDRRRDLTQRPRSALGGSDGRPLRFKLIGGAARPPPSAEAILPLGGAATDEFITRLAVWLAGVAMNEQGAA